MQTRAKKVKKPESAASAQHPQIFYRLHALLGTIRSIERHEDQLCTLLHEVESTGKVEPAVSRELTELLDGMPSSEYLEEMNAVRSELDALHRISKTGLNTGRGRHRSKEMGETQHVTS